MTEEKVKRKPGNPNWVKKDTTIATATVPVADRTAKYEIVPAAIPNDTAWLKLYGSILSTYNIMSPAIVAAAAKTADMALNEFRTRYPK